MATQPQKASWTIKRVLEWTEGYLSKKGDEHPLRSAQWLLCSALDMTRVELYLHYDQVLTQPELDRMHRLVEARAQGKPLQYITGEMAFRHIVVTCKAGVLIPRPETETLVEYALSHLSLVHQAKRCGQVLEIGTGTGCVALSLALEAPPCHVVATDISEAACDVAKHNVSALHATDAVDIIHTSYADNVDPALKGQIDVLISNPPYIPSRVVETLAHEVRDFEPRLALDGGEDGLSAFRNIVSVASTFLRPGGLLCVELFEDALVQAKDIAEAYDIWQSVKICEDLAHKPRFIVAIRKGDIQTMTQEEEERARARAQKLVAVDQNAPADEVVARATEVLAHEGVIIVPTDSVYGIGCVATPHNPALIRTFEIKHRDLAQTLPWLVADADALSRFGKDVPVWAYALAEKYWPGALTLVVKASEEVGEEYVHAENHTIALRLPNSEIVRALARTLGHPLAITSANTHGADAATSGDTIEERLLDEVDLALDAGKAPIGEASTIVDCTRETPRILRVGAISPEDIASCINEVF